MCGIVGKINFDSEMPVDPGQIKRMADSIRHRGPDDEGVWVNGNAGLGHRRLSIIDLSASGRNPMCNEDETIWIVFNGEVYNFHELRAELVQKGHRFRSRTDTEVILHLYEEVGVDCVKWLVGMFAFAIWDQRKQRLLLARDRLGKKPLFYSLDNSRLLFGSEIKAILRSGEVGTSPDLQSLHQFLLWQCISSPRTAFIEISKLPPASTLVWKQGEEARIERYWKLNYAYPLDDSEEEVAEQVRSLTTEATRVRLIADVPVGLFLSGGVDSACVLAAVRRTFTGPIRTFSVAFGEQQFDESPYARLLARHFVTEHHEFKASPEIVDLLPRMAELFDEPFADPAAIPTYYLSKLTRAHVKVALSGDGGDEAFGGYQRYLAMKMLRLASSVPGSKYLVGARALLPYGTGQHSKTRFLREMLPLLGRTPEQQYTAIFSGMMQSEQWTQLYTPEFRMLLNDADDGNFILWNGHGESDVLASAMASDTLRYIPECLNVKVDVASMACGLEVRSPFLDHRVVELCARIPSSMKIKGWTQKAILKRAFATEVPKTILQRGKSGFTVPLSKWLRHPLRDFAYSTLLSQNSNLSGVIAREKISAMLHDHCAEKHNWHVQLWRLLVLESWLGSIKTHSYAHSA